MCSQAWIAAARAAAHVAPGTGSLFQAPTADSISAAPTRPDGDPDAPVTQGGRVASTLPNDTYFQSHQVFSLKTIGAVDAWEVSYGGGDVTVAIISSGVDYRHPDLASKIWRNADEVTGNGIDDDGNGYVDDTRGWNFPDQNGDPMDFAAGLRGTMMAGIVAAETNNREGIAGVSWYARIMPLKVLFEYEYVYPDGRKVPVAAGQDDDIIEAVCYAANNDAGVILLAPTLRDPRQVVNTMDRLRQAIEYAHRAGAVIVAPAGDCGGDPWADGRTWCPDPDTYGDNGENPVIFPANFPFVIGVQSVAPNSQMRAEASSGPWVDISAPGEEFMTTGLDGDYRPVRFWEPHAGGWRAVSDFAAAHVAGVAAVMRTVDPWVTPLRTLKHLCTAAKRPAGVQFEDDGSGWPRNDRYGCGVLDFEHTLEGMPWTVHGVSPVELTVLTDGNNSSLDGVLSNPFLNKGKWEIRESVGWLSAVAAPQRTGTSSSVRLTTDIVNLRQAHGGRIVNSTFTETLWACPVGSVNEGDRQFCDNGANVDPRCPCQKIPYRLKVVEQVRHLFLPLIVDD